MQYLLMVYDDEKTRTHLDEAGRTALTAEYATFTQEIVKSGHFRAGSGLQPTSTATTVRKKGDKPVIADGPFAETKEQLGGYYLVECKDLDDALKLAVRVPAIRHGGTVEVRPLMVYPEGMRQAL